MSGDDRTCRKFCICWSNCFEEETTPSFLCLPNVDSRSHSSRNDDVPCQVTLPKIEKSCVAEESNDDIIGRYIIITLLRRRKGRRLIIRLCEHPPDTVCCLLPYRNCKKNNKKRNTNKLLLGHLLLPGWS